MSALASHRDCPVCGAVDAQPVYRQRFAVEDDGRRIAGYDVVVCRPCGAVYADGIPPQEVLDAYYRDSSKYEYLAQQGHAPDWLLDSHRELVRGLTPILHDRSAKIVDVGCGNGDVLGLLRAAGFESLLGVDPAPQSAEAAARLHQVRVLQGGAFSLPPEARGAGCVILSAVLEHLRDVSLGLRAVSEALAPHGLLYVEVPDLQRFAEHPVTPFQQFSVEHINYFTVASLSNAAVRAGLAPVENWRATRSTGAALEPTICAVFLRSSEPIEPSARDEVGEVELHRYVDVCARREASLARRIDDLVAAQTPVILWGVGTHTLHLLETTALSQAHIVAMVDVNPRLHGLRVAGHSVVGPEEITARDEAILVCSPGHQDAIAAMARNHYGMSNEVIVLQQTEPADASPGGVRWDDLGEEP